MRFNRESHSAYQGKGWAQRISGMSEEIADDCGIWAPMKVDSEYKRLKAVLLYCPGKELEAIKNPNDVQHVGRISPAKIEKEYRSIISVYEKLGIKVYLIDPRSFGANGKPDKYNLMYVRDLFFNTPEGAVVARMASRVRAGEEKYAASALAAMGVPVNRTVAGKGLFEGADALWLSPRTVMCGIGNRTNREGYSQLRAMLEAQGVEAVPVELPRTVQHLLGLVQIVDVDLALVRTQSASSEITCILKKKGFSIVPVPETDEVRIRQGMNIVTVAPRSVIMPRGCPGLKRIFRKAGICVAAEAGISQLINGAGGLACATGILSRASVLK